MMTRVDPPVDFNPEQEQVPISSHAVPSVCLLKYLLSM